ncbi:MAG: 4-hydroxy-3-methylbut-2-enyl diphosphate reductase [Pseudomonadales bacterium]|jgi:4-hydroxy-3-methylbut-2-en-1-yl diphosphate reductase|nr:4-hydroxy-3-methylbut-2-enyl diphosphate reductase [Pseudomonadales bacterium]MDP4765470.1 4-hydroxy-3-methylbut-2-enyl diphosphate reductase [Pseudomonadales bacterium]MDP4875155.1 4-hydroxy-3-methylbut-2-enyl diphosphate reductase [Pseudomonadales bacterium]MDP4910828.1 4-hydroxy-3-methylbut-2-enyl diphosphate reductase [Pseudomonadales bacterium]MDP5058451.1 4-hydroxy-3-methylbut-2-enyl diphosphate reductase [Pseudomonadales bacterium]
MLKEIILASPRGFCAGVDRAIEIVNRALEIYGAPVYVRHEVVHNRTVVESLRAKGAVFVDEVDAIPAGALVIFSAHGVSQQVRADAEAKQLRVFDATCPLVTKVHNEVSSFSRDRREAILIGHAGHPEVQGTMGQYADPTRIYLIESVEDVDTLQLVDDSHVSYVTQTTLSVDDTSKVIDRLRQRYPKIEGPRKDDICYATQNRQDAVKQLAAECDLILVVGSGNSSNSNRLRELAARLGVKAYLIDEAAEIDNTWLVDIGVVGVTSGASAPENLVEGVIAHLQQTAGPAPVRTLLTREENIEFSLPKGLRRPADGR